jgi:hypothetical protein
VPEVLLANGRRGSEEGMRTTPASSLFCCSEMEEHATRKCDSERRHDDRLDCPDTVIHQYASGSFGIPIHDGGHSFITVSYCPWCGATLA